MKNLKKLLWLVPLLGLIYMYANQGVGVLIGSREHYDILAALAWSREVTSALVWLSVVIDIGMAFLLLFFPSTLVFVAAGLWTWVPHIITLIAPGPENEFLESFLVTALATLAFLAFKQGYVIPIRTWFTKNLAPAVSSSREVAASDRG